MSRIEGHALMNTHDPLPALMTYVLPCEQDTSKTALAVLKLQKKLPNCRFIYVSATAATLTKDLVVMTRLGLWGPGTAFENSHDFAISMTDGGCGAMELVAMHMKASGQYLSRMLSFENATFEICEQELEEKFTKTYNESCLLWKEIFEAVNDFVADGNTLPPAFYNIMWGANQRFYIQMCMAAKVHCATLK